MSGSSTFCRAVARASRLKVWKTKPISLLRMRASWSSSSSLTSWPFSQYLPLEGVSRQPMRFIRVDLPDPDGHILIVLDAHGDAAQRLHLLLHTHIVGAP